MNMNTVKRSMPALLLASVTLPVTAGSWATAAHAATPTKTYKGTVQQMQQWGAIQVAIVIKNHKITGVKATTSAHTQRSIDIQSNALPILKSETLQAQSARVNEVSGATDMSVAYTASLQAAIKSAKQHKALK